MKKLRKNLKILKNKMLEKKREIILITSITFLGIVIIIFAVKITNKVNELNDRLDHYKLLNGMLFEDMERTYEYTQEQGIDSEIKID